MLAIVASSFAVIITLSSIAQPQSSDPPPPLRACVVLDDDRLDTPAPLQHGSFRSHPILIDLSTGALRSGDQLACTLFPDVAFRLNVEQSAVSSTGARMVSGSVKQHPHGWFSLAVRAGTVSGYIWTGADRMFALRTTDRGAWAFEVDTQTFQPCATGEDGRGPVGPAARDIDGVAGNTCDDGSVIEVLVCYTPLARAAAGGTAAILAEIDLAVEAANTSYANSQIAPRLSVVGALEIGYQEVGTYFDHLYRLTDPDDGIMDEVHALRNAHGADLVALFVDDGDYCGVAWLAPFDPNLGFSVTTWYCAAATLTMAHEVGHNQGCCHAVGDGGGCTGGGVYSYSVGWRFVGNSGTLWRTVMAYAPAARILHFSNPSVSFDGQPTGVPVGQPNAANNALTIDQTALSVANFRCSLSTLWVNFAYVGVETGSQSQPFNTIAEAVGAVLSGGTIQVLSGSSSLPVTISKALTINAVGGPVTLGQ